MSVMNTHEVRQARRGRLLTLFQEFVRTESAGGLVLIVAAAIAFLWANVAHVKQQLEQPRQQRPGIHSTDVSGSFVSAARTTARTRGSPFDFAQDQRQARRLNGGQGAFYIWRPCGT